MGGDGVSDGAGGLHVVHPSHRGVYNGTEGEGGYKQGVDIFKW